MSRRAKRQAAAKRPTRADEHAALMAKVRAAPGESREKVRAALRELERQGRKVTVNSVRELAGIDRSACAVVLAGWREQLLDLDRSWARLDGTAEPEGAAAEGAAPESSDPRPAGVDLEALLAAIEAATSPAGLAGVANTVSRLVAGGQLEVSAGRLVLDACREQRQSLADARKLDPPAEDPTRYLLASAEAMQVARALDLLVSDERRDRVLAFVADVLEEDRRLDPNCDEGGL